MAFRSLLLGRSAAQRCMIARQLSSRPEDLNLILPDALRIDEVRSDGFTVSNVHVEGAVLLTGDMFTLWRARCMEDVTLDSLALLRVLRPAPDLLVVGCGQSAQRLPLTLARQLHEMGVRVDAMDTVNAVATFNVLNQESRKVVGAFLPQGVES